MRLTDIKQIKEEADITEVNRLLETGWSILAIATAPIVYCLGTRDQDDLGCDFAISTHPDGSRGVNLLGKTSIVLAPKAAAGLANALLAEPSRSTCGSPAGLEVSILSAGSLASDEASAEDARPTPEA